MFLDCTDSFSKTTLRQNRHKIILCHFIDFLDKICVAIKGGHFNKLMGSKTSIKSIAIKNGVYMYSLYCLTHCEIVNRLPVIGNKQYIYIMGLSAIYVICCAIFFVCMVPYVL